MEYQDRKSCSTAIITSIVSALLLSTPVVHADITTTGDVDPIPIVSPVQTVTVGNIADGTLLIDNGSVVKSYFGVLGVDPGITGSATVTGAGSQWNKWDTIGRALYLTVGDGGQGVLNIFDGGLVNTSDTYLASDPGSIGSVTVSGMGSMLMSSNLFVGWLGDASLTVVNSGQVSVSSLFATPADLHGDGTINANYGAVLDADLVFDATHGPTQIFSFGSGGTLNLTTHRSGSLGAGYRGAGSLQIADAQVMRSSSGYFGYQPDSNGVGTISGAGTSWTVGRLYLGYHGQGALTVENAAQVITTYELVLGYSSTGTGSLTVNDTAQVTAGSLYGSLSNLHGNGTISITDGAVLDDDVVIDAAQGSIATLAFGTGGTLTLATDRDGVLGAGYKSTGTLLITGSQTIESDRGYIGYHPGSIGTVTITGNGATWDISNSLYVGYYGQGTLNIINGGDLARTDVEIGYLSGSTGLVTVTGSGSTMVNDYLYVGYYGQGSLLIQNHGQVTSSYGYIGNEEGSSGAVTVTGSGSSWTSGTILSTGYASDGSLDIEAGGQVTAKNMNIGYKAGVTGVVNVSGSNSLLTITDPGGFPILRVGSHGNGTLNVTEGGRVNVINVGATYIGAFEGSNGTAIISGSGSSFTSNGPVYVGAWGTGSLTVEDGATVTVGSLYASPDNLHGNGTISASGGVVLDHDLFIDASHDFPHSMSFGDGGTLTFSLNMLGVLGVGYKSEGTLHVGDSRNIHSAVGYLGYHDGSHGTGTVDGPDSLWGIEHALYLGYYGGVGELNIQNGAHVYYANAGSGACYLGHDPDAIGLINVIGENATFSGKDMLILGIFGQGTLNILDGGHVSNTEASLGWRDTGVGLVNVTGSGSLWYNSDDLNVGYEAQGTVNITGGGRVESNRAYVGLFGTGSVLVHDDGSIWANTGNLYIGYEGPGYVTVRDDGLVTAAQIIIGQTGQLLGNSAVTGQVSNAGQICPGLSAGTLRINGNYTQQSTGSLQIEFDINHSNDLLQITGAAALNGTLDLQLLHDFAPTLGDFFTVLTASLITGHFNIIDGLNINDDLAFAVNYSNTAVTVTAALSGDANFDGQVNLADLQILGDNWLSTDANWVLADFTGDGQVNLADLQVLGDHWGYGTSNDLAFEDALQQVGVQVPEPEVLAVALLSLCVWRGQRRVQ